MAILSLPAREQGKNDEESEERTSMFSTRWATEKKYRLYGVSILHKPSKKPQDNKTGHS
jgi:hypothetical protein